MFHATPSPHHRFMGQALCLAEEALARHEFPVGCVLVEGGEVVAVGRRQNSGEANEMDHAEIVALRAGLGRAPALDMGRVTVYTTMEPCLMCHATLLLNGIRSIVYAYEDVMGGGTSLDLSRLAPLYRDMSVTVLGGVRRSESLALFQRFFQDPAHGYWRDSLLARHTLAQTITPHPE